MNRIGIKIATTVLLFPLTASVFAVCFIDGPTVTCCAAPTKQCQKSIPNPGGDPDPIFVTWPCNGTTTEAYEVGTVALSPTGYEEDDCDTAGSCTRVFYKCSDEVNGCDFDYADPEPHACQDCQADEFSEFCPSGGGGEN